MYTSTCFMAITKLIAVQMLMHWLKPLSLSLHMGPTTTRLYNTIFTHHISPGWGRGHIHLDKGMSVFQHWESCWLTCIEWSHGQHIIRCLPSQSVAELCQSQDSSWQVQQAAALLQPLCQLVGRGPTIALKSGVIKLKLSSSSWSCFLYTASSTWVVTSDSCTLSEWFIESHQIMVPTLPVPHMYW